VSRSATQLLRAVNDLGVRNGNAIITISIKLSEFFFLFPRKVSFETFERHMQSGILIQFQEDINFH